MKRVGINATEDNLEMPLRAAPETSNVAMAASESDCTAVFHVDEASASAICHAESTNATATMQAGEVVQVEKLMENNYDKLINKPTLNGHTIQGNMQEEDPTVPSWSKQQKKPSYIASEVGAVDEDDLIPLTVEDLKRMYNSL